MLEMIKPQHLKIMIFLVLTQYIKYTINLFLLVLIHFEMF